MSAVREARDRAAQWIVAREEPGWTADDQRALDRWLAESDLNRITYLRLDEGWRQSDRLAALGGTGQEDAPPAPQPEPVRRTPVWWMPTAIAASLAVLVGGGWAGRSWFADRPAAVATTRYDTKIGGHRLVALSDGSRVELNTASVVRTAVTAQRREVWLDQGEAFFEIAHDRSHPFVVHAGSREVTVLGTKFSVRRDGGKVTVSVLEGRVRVDDVADGGTGRSTTITGGDIAVAQGAATLVTARSEQRVEGALAWREGILSFDQERLIDIAAEFNRYNRKRLVIGDITAADMRIGGNFPASQPQAFVKLLRDAYGLRIEESDEAIKISS